MARQTVHTWLRRYAAEGLAGLVDRSSKPGSCPHQMPAEIEVRVVEMRRAHPGWGPRTIGYHLEQDGFAETDTRDGAVLRIESPGLAVWVDYSGHGVGGNMAWFDHNVDRVTVKNPDEEILIKMYEVAQVLAAKVQGDDGEEYDAGGRPIRTEGGEESSRSKPWWRFWT